MSIQEFNLLQSRFVFLFQVLFNDNIWDHDQIIAALMFLVNQKIHSVYEFLRTITSLALCLAD